MLLIVTNSMDGTTDLLLQWLPHGKEVFRFNVDIWNSYQIEITNDVFILQDPSGRSITEDTCSGLYIRKPYFLDEDRFKPLGGDIETWNQHQIQGIVDGLYSICLQKGLVRLVERLADRRVPKILQMRLAKQFFEVPQWSISLNKDDLAIKDPVVCKSLRSAFVFRYQSLFTSRLNVRDVEPGHSWFLQSLVPADADVTVVYVDGHLFAFARLREELDPLDYRESLKGQDEGWICCEIPKEMRHAIARFMNILDLSFGRLDFLMKDDSYYFLEVNPNGQFAWLDPDNKTGLLSCIAEAIAL